MIKSICLKFFIVSAFLCTVALPSYSADGTAPQSESKNQYVENVGKDNELDKIQKKLKNIVIDRIVFEDVALPTVVKYLKQKSKQLDPEKEGVNIFLKLSHKKPEEIPTVTLAVENTELGATLNYICKLANVKYRVEKYAVVITSNDVPFEDVDTKIYPLNQGAEGSKDGISDKLNKIVFDQIEFNEASIGAIVAHLNLRSKQLDPDGVGVNLIFRLSDETAKADPKVTMSFDQIPMSEVLRYLCQGTGLKYRIEEQAILIGDDEKLKTVGKTWAFVIEPQFDNAYGFSDGLAAVRLGDYKTGKWGFIDKTGKFIIKPTFGNAESFSEGLARIRIGNYETGKWGFIDKTGKFIIKPTFGNAESFSEGLAPVSKGKCIGTSILDFPVKAEERETWKHGFIDKTGKFVIEAQFDDARDFSEGLAPARSGYYYQAGKWGFIDKTGKFVIEPQFDFAWGFSEGLALVRIGNYETGKWGFIDKTGKFVINPKFDFAWKFTDGLAPVRLGDEKTGKWGFIDKTGKFVIEPQFGNVGNFSEGLTPVKLGDEKTGKWGFIDKTGKFVIKPLFDSANDFSDGLASVSTTGKWGYIKVCCPKYCQKEENSVADSKESDNSEDFSWKVSKTTEEINAEIKTIVLKKSRKKFPQKLLSKILDEANSLYPPLEIGKEITVPIHFGKDFINYTGKFKGEDGNYIIVGDKKVYKEDLPENIKSRINKRICEYSIKQYVDALYYREKKEYEASLRKKLEAEKFPQYGYTKYENKWMLTYEAEQEKNKTIYTDEDWKEHLVKYARQYERNGYKRVPIIEVCPKCNGKGKYTYTAPKKFQEVIQCNTCWRTGKVQKSMGSLPPPKNIKMAKGYEDLAKEELADKNPDDAIKYLNISVLMGNSESRLNKLYGEGYKQLAFDEYYAGHYVRSESLLRQALEQDSSITFSEEEEKILANMKQLAAQESLKNSIASATQEANRRAEEQNRKLDEQKRALDEQNRKLDEQRRALDEQNRKLDEMNGVIRVR